MFQLGVGQIGFNRLAGVLDAVFQIARSLLDQRAGNAAGHADFLVTLMRHDRLVVDAGVGEIDLRLCTASRGCDAFFQVQGTGNSG